MQKNIVARWFGPDFDRLHPLIQTLHQQGGQLNGVVSIEHGRGLGGWLGRRLCKKLGIPTEQSRCDLNVTIRSDENVLYWDRRFAGGSVMASQFHPVGVYPSGYWIEQTGPIHLRLAVDILDTGWHWRVLAIYLYGLRLPLWLFPRSSAYKTIKDGKYLFNVAFALPILGTILSYAGALDTIPKGKNINAE